MGKLKSLKGIEVFSAGKWNGDTYTEDDLDEMVRCFAETGNSFRPAVKIGHDEKQRVAREIMNDEMDGFPALGWAERVYRQGKKLLADFMEVPEKIYELIKRRAFKRVSSEVYWDIEIDGKKYRRALGAVALLGADMPGVSNLKEIFQLYTEAAVGGARKCYDLDSKSFTIEIEQDDLPNEGAQDMTKEELDKQAADLAAAQKANADLAAKLEAQSAELKQFKLDADKRAKDAEDRAAEAELDSAVTDLVSTKLVTPAMKPYVKALLQGETKKQYSLAVGKDGEKKDFSKSGLLKEILKLHSVKATVNVEESSVDHEVETKQTDSEKALNTKIEKYQADHKCSYKTAYKAVMAESEVDSEVEDDEEVDA